MMKERQCQVCGLIFDTWENVPKNKYVCSFCKKKIEEQKKASKQHNRCLKILERRKQLYG